jgi:hypothetical protein
MFSQHGNNIQVVKKETMMVAPSSFTVKEETPPPPAPADETLETPLADRLPRTYISKLVVQMKSCLTQLDAEVTYPQLESIAILIHESMSSSSRNYHSVQHVFDISEDLVDPIAILSAFFHDCIYYHVDGSFTPGQADILDGVYQADSEQYKFFASAEDSNDHLLKMVECIFGYSPGQEVTNGDGLNEFLSAIIAVRQLKDHLSIERLTQITCCIEATIPFRPKNKETGLGPMERLHVQMEDARRRFDLKLDDEDLVKSVQRASILSNNDVGNFGTPDRHWFLDNTWSLLPETNETLRQQYLYTVKNFHHGIFKMYGFFGFLQPSVVFHSFRGVPNDEELSVKIGQCTQNLELGKKYVGAKLLSMSLLAAFAELTGGDGPMSLFMGDLPSRHHVSSKISDALPTPSENSLKNCDQDVYSILAHGRRTETSFDIRQSPLAAYLYSYLGDEGLSKLLNGHKWFPITEENGVELLTAFPRVVVEAVARNMMRVALSRADMINEVLTSLPNVHNDGNLSAVAE